VRVVIGLGSNVGDRLANLREATSRIAALGTVLARSSIYETAPVGGPAQADFLNAALLVEYMESASALLAALQSIEHDLGRVRTERWGPRTIDLDILWIDGEAIETPDLVVPHPRLGERAFALAPLLDVAPDAPYARPTDGAVRLTDLSF
jgi:2-amino-4-hydroxy-6-hydroxymethyldihydropteridine diphosphokinase